MKNNLTRKLSFIFVCVFLFTSIFYTFPSNAETVQEIQGFVDELDNFKLMYDHSSDKTCGFDASNEAMFRGDKSRFLSNREDGQFLSYKTDYDIESFSTDVYYWDGQPVTDIKVLVSSDDKDYQPVELEKYEAGGSWKQVVFSSYKMPIENARYLKIVIPDVQEGEFAWAVQISRVIINLNTRPVSASPTPGKIAGSSAEIELTTDTEGAEIYYYTGTDKTLVKYTRPISISSATQVYAFAKKDGLQDSYTKTFTYYTPADEKIDKYGQVKSAEFATKVKSDSELKGDLAADAEYYSSLKPPERDKYNGMIGSKEKYDLSATGFFHTQTLSDGRTVLVTPEGTLYFSLGATGVGYYGDTFTVVKDREYIYQWLPGYEKGSKFETAYRTQDKSADFSFYASNKIIKTDKPMPSYDEFYEESVYRLEQWGFTGAGGWSGGPLQSGSKQLIPTVQHLELGSDNENGMGGMNCFDIFAEGAAENIDNYFKENLVPNVDNPYIVGYFFANEQSYNNLKKMLPSKKASEVAAKKVLVDMLKKDYVNIEKLNTEWETAYTSFDEMYEAQLPINTDEANNDLNKFVGIYLDTLYKTAADTFHKYDKNHLILGDRWLASIPKDSELRELMCKAAGKYMDVISYNYYTFALDIDLLKEMHELSGKPIMLTEFMYASPDQGITGGVKVANDEVEKGLAYRNYVEQAAATGFVVGAHWFEYLDQAATGRWFQGYQGEAFACGLVNVADRPYKVMLDSVMKTNYDIYDVVTGDKAPYSYDFGPTRGERKSDKTLLIPETKTAITIDGVLDDEWTESPMAVMNEKDLISGSEPEGKKADMYLAWDKNNLYVLAKIDDPTPMQNPYKGADIWNGDGVELFTGPEKIDSVGALKVKDNQIILSGGIVEGAPQYNAYRSANQPDIKMAVKQNADGIGYILEAAIPMSAVSVNDPAVGRRIRFDMGFDDGDGTARKRQWFWNGVDGNHMSRDKWGMAVFVEGSKTEGEDRITRADAVYSIVKALELNKDKYNNAFADVKADKWYAEVVQTAFNAKIISGYKGKFRPEEFVTRQEMAVMLSNAYKSISNKDSTNANIDILKDISSISGYAINSVKTVYGLGIMSGATDNSFEPKAALNRSQFNSINFKLLQTEAN